MSLLATHFEKKKIHDPVHGTIYLSDLETQVINSKAFQRLRNIKQLGLAHFVFPGAEYSRFTHSLGVCHLCGELYDARLKLEFDEEKGCDG
ncbi:HD superfamily phosphohydrolase [Methanohalophilus levihalophilus]|nr:HD superfamily phosphohydrolase [Methanohalophilus levihalophilus]